MYIFVLCKCTIVTLIYMYDPIIMLIFFSYKTIARESVFWYKFKLCRKSETLLSHLKKKKLNKLLSLLLQTFKFVKGKWVRLSFLS